MYTNFLDKDKSKKPDKHVLATDHRLVLSDLK